MAKEKKIEEKNPTALDNALSEIEKMFGKGIITNLEAKDAYEIECISTGSLAVDAALGKGIPRGRIVELYGTESSGKTLLALNIIAEAQKNGKKCAFIDIEFSFDKDWAKLNGVNTKDLIFSQPSNAEETLSVVEKLAESNEVAIIVVDSVASLICKAELDGELGQSHMALTARLMAQALRKLVGVCAKSQTTLIFINQLRANLGVTYGPTLVTTGGNSLKYFASIRCELKRKETIKKGEEILATLIEVNIKKNKVFAPYKKGCFEIRFDSGMCRASDLINLALENGIISKGGAWFEYKDQKFQGQENLRQYVKTDEKVQNDLRKEILEAIEAQKDATE